MIYIEYDVQDVLENPLHTEAGHDMETFHSGEIIAEFHLAAKIEVLGAEAVPELGLGKHHGIVALAPDIEEARETQAGSAEEVLAAPDRGELEGNLRIEVHELFVQEFEVERILEVSAVKEIIHAEQPGRPDRLPQVPKPPLYSTWRLSGASAEFCQKFRQRAISK